MKKIIAIIAGGDSSEYEVSLRSAEGISSWLDRNKFIVYTIEVKGLEWKARLQDGSTTEVNRHDFSFIENGQKIKPDFAYITIHGTPGENGILQGYFDLIHVPYSTCSLLIAALTFDKFMLNQYLKGYGVKVSDSILLRKGQTITPQQVEETIGLPCFIKPNGSGSSFGVTRCIDKDDIKKAIEFARTECDEVMIEAELKGTEIANGVYQKKDGSIYVFPITEVVSQNEFFDYNAKYNGQVTEITPARLSNETTQRVKELTRAIYSILGGSGIMRVDYIITKKDEQDVINLLEINATPGMTQTSFIPQQARADGLDMQDIMTEIIESKLGL